MAGLCEGGNEPAGPLKVICKFADDLTLLAEDEMILRDMLLELNNSCEQYGMKINANKTKTMVIGRKTKKEEEKELVESLAEKKLPTEGCSGRNGEREKSSGRYQIIDDIKMYGSYEETKRKAENRKAWRKLGLQ
ncbi:hypothetical protein ANN_09016 [Periplaneta americana]|uniref:Reverse transcriptase domain-containing protein n=1 Tax=Periplaneta americana TaxID=6978 RepID=A0ABQ8TK81_PERAM|nr:hypothetical protein ANN_09016 [Periplaneta americana]